MEKLICRLSSAEPHLDCAKAHEQLSKGKKRTHITTRRYDGLSFAHQRIQSYVSPYILHWRVKISMGFFLVTFSLLLDVMQFEQKKVCSLEMLRLLDLQSESSPIGGEGAKNM